MKWEVKKYSLKIHYYTFMFNNDFETATIIKIIFIIIFQRTTSVLSCLVTELFFSVVDKRTLAPKSNLHETVLQANFKERRDADVVN